MKLLLACEGDAETRDSWSGISKSVLDELRVQGHHVVTANAELRGAGRWLAAGLTFSPDRSRWGAKYRLSSNSSLLRSQRVGALVDRHRPSIDAVLQFGATFQAVQPGSTPYFLYCDSNIRMAEHGAASGHTDASALSAGQLRRIRKREARIYRGAATIFTISERLRESFIEDFQIEPSRVRTVHAGPNFDTGMIAARSAGSSPRADRAPTILFVGRQFARKGGDALLAAFRSVRERIPNARLVIVGPERLETSLEGVECLGFLDKDRADHRAALLDAYASADVFCLPTRFEPFGIVFLEAMYFGLPCVGSNAWAVPEMISDGTTGYTVPIGDEAALADRLVRLLADPLLAHRLGDAGRARAQSHFTWSAVVRRMTDAMERVTLEHAAV